jgi:hypothetical protein
MFAALGNTCVPRRHSVRLLLRDQVAATVQNCASLGTDFKSCLRNFFALDRPRVAQN